MIFAVSSGGDLPQWERFLLPRYVLLARCAGGFLCGGAATEIPTPDFFLTKDMYKKLPLGVSLAFNTKMKPLGKAKVSPPQKKRFPP